ncbi:MAG: transcription antitermination factor NusB [Alphaproteobacteria bacterium]
MQPKQNPSLQKKSAARMAVVQALYQRAITGDASDAAKETASLKEQLSGNRSEQRLMVGVPLEPNYPLFEALLSGVNERMDEVNTRLDEVLTSDWKRERMSHLLVALLQCGIYEMFFHKEIKSNIVIDEYTRMARSFFSDKEVDFVHGALSTLAATYG